ncbi:cytochrome ubiquinol oxidase subunit I [Pseudoroseomonas wenyumeiae]|uniref:Cytochrome ubiquinol oxidase subunit I n=1 Tax=Teichococcus wenyumeiae TaxID=2478470 RepID=A0A3A9JI07_9PROT|nr:cytochrome ubiquinol oxidase subunit I [Pseudoroseomonas wenyumeiae]RKK04911.1 cytochrome ubiquinol oxidase subunit I [Pseudoroseomonas wenyumeiae]RMI26142.1 cytochrome ubiquinol oxidase subunit I [Pseudoroseomonas wenyumeiae]
MGWDWLPSALDLARFQFAFTVSFHFLFPAFTIGLASFLAVLEGLWLYTGRSHYLDLFRYWLKVFAIAFAMGVVSGVVMSYQFGTNWARFSDQVGNILGPVMAYEVLTAFFLEAGFLGIMLFGLERVGKKLHFLATLLVAVGTLFSSFWILSANSWMQTPAGYSIAADGRFMPADWWAIIFNPSFPYRLAHTVTAAYLTTAFIVGGVAAFHLLRDERNPRTRIMFSMAMWMAAIVAPIQIVIGDFHGLNTLKYQPQKVAAMEGHWERQRGAPLIVLGQPDMATEETRVLFEIPHLSALILTHEWNGETPGLKDVPADQRPTNVPLVFWSFRIMVAIGTLMALLGVVSLWLRWRGRLYTAPLFHRAAVAMGPAGLIAVIAGWITTEAGRQPFTVYNLLRTADSVSPLQAPAVGASLLGFILVYFIVFGAGVLYLFKLFSHSPHDAERGPKDAEPIRTAGITPGPPQLQHHDADPRPQQQRS